MNKKITNSITILNFVILLLLVVFIVFFYNHEQNKTTVVYVDNIKLFHEFDMSKDLKKINSEKINKQKKKLDSLYTIYQIFKDNKQTNKLSDLENKLRNEDKELKKISDYFSNEVSKKIWNRLNEYIKEYGEEKKYKLIVGTQGSGNVMFGEDDINVTEDLLLFSNKKYEGF